MKPETWHVRYTFRPDANWGASRSHAVDNVTLRSMCGKNGEGWFIVKVGMPARHVDCVRCRKAIEKERENGAE